MPYLTPRCNSIARILLERERPITIEELTRELHVSARTVRYDLDILEDWLEEKGVRLVRKSRVGVYLDTGSSGYAELSSHFERSGDSQRVYSGPERHQILTRELLGGAPRTLGELAALTNVSKTTAFRDLEEVEGWLKERRIVLVKGHGMSASGSELDIRKALADVVYEEHGSRTLLRLAHARPKEQGGAWLEGRRQIAAPILAGTVWRFQRELGMSFTDESAVELFVHLGVGLVRADQRHYVSIPEQNMEHLQTTEEYAAVKRTLTALAERLGIELPTEELCYFTMHVLGAGVSHLYRSGGTGTHGEEYFRTAVADFTAEISSRLGVDLSEDTELQEDLMVELRPWVSRAQFQVGLERQNAPELLEAYRETYQAVWAGMPILEVQFNVKFNEALAAELSAHIAAAEERRKQLRDSNKYVTAIVVCGTGLGTAKLLSSRISGEFSQIKVLQEMSLAEFGEFDASSVDIVFSAIPMEGETPSNLIEVTPLLDLESKAKIYRFLGENFTNYENRDRYIQKIMMIVEDNCIIEDRKKLHEELERFLYMQKVHSLTDGAQTRSMGALVTRQHIAFQAQAADYREAIAIGGELLLRDGVIDREYIDAMVEHTANFVSNVVVAPSVALAHAAPKGHVRDVCMSMVLLQEAVPFGHFRNDPVKLVVCLGTVNDQTHEKAIRDFLKILESKYLLDNILNARSVKEILLTINGIC